jgi:hypothetical protein
MADWSRHFDEPIPLPNGRELVTLKEAGTYIAKLPKAEHEAPEWQAAAQALILVATKGGWPRHDPFSSTSVLKLNFEVRFDELFTVKC